jgi:hypothetical protein
MALTKINNNTLSAITGLPAGVGGKVLQVVQASISTSVSSTSATFVSAGFTATLPSLSSTSSKVLCTLAGGRTSYNDGAVNPNRLSVTLFSSIGGATATDIMPTAPFSNFDLISGSPGYSWSHSGCFLYSPSTTSSVAITPYFRVPNDDGTPFFNHATTSGEGSDIPATVTITLMEIAG